MRPDRPRKHGGVTCCPEPPIWSRPAQPATALIQSWCGDVWPAVRARWIFWSTCTKGRCTACAFALWATTKTQWTLRSSSWGGGASGAGGIPFQVLALNRVVSYRRQPLPESGQSETPGHRFPDTDRAADQRVADPIVVVMVTLLLVGGNARAQRAPQVGLDLSPAEVQQLFDACMLVQAQDALSLTDEQSVPFVSSLKRLQDVRRRNQQQEHRQLRTLDQTAARGNTSDRELETRLQALDDHRTRATASVRTA